MKKLFFLAVILILVSAGALSSPVFLSDLSGSVPDKSAFTLDPKIGKEVKVDLSLQKVFLLEKGQLVAEYLISSGKPETPTPVGKFRVILKQDRVYSKIAGCWLAFWVGFTNDGKYGFHETPICDGQREGEDKLGQPVSLGCIRLKLGDAEEFYKWVDIETPIEILD